MDTNSPDSHDHEPSLAEANARADRRRTPWLVAGALFLGLVGFCVIGGPVVMGLLNAWESARRTMCADHLRQTARALQSHHEVHGAFPPGWIVEAEQPPAGTVSPAWAWQAMILPLLNTQQTYLLPDDTARPLSEVFQAANVDQQELLAQAVEAFLCPSDEAFAFDGANHPARRWVVDGQPVAWGLSMSVGNTGHRHDIRGAEPNSGIFYGNSSVTLADVTDGISYTILIGERDLTRCRAGTWVGIPDPWSHDGGPSIWNAVAGARPGINAEPWDGETLCGEGFSSLHPEGVNVALVDGSVRFLNSAIDATWTADPTTGEVGVLQQMMMRSDGLEPMQP